ncbi:hypothetical protein L1049_013464 [Liquidambar formosana]|uniref:Peptidase A1 domain-containing protein n=1 Tax=Liquidambar formosana TaxID=63359 RepID=A0AAP0RNX9_LIQFO
MEGKATALVFSILLVSLSSTAFSKPLTPSWPESESQTLTLLETASETSITLPLVHRDALAFNTTREALFKLRLQRDAARIKTLTAMAAAAKKKGADLSSSIISGYSQGIFGEYLALVGVGTPPQYEYMNLDTGSNLVWIQCAPCMKCYNQTRPIFNPKKSKTFAPVSCTSHLCPPSPLNCSRRHTCLYGSAYGDKSTTIGEFSIETLTFGRTRVPNMLLGCGRYNKGQFSGSAGILGLGRLDESFTVQTSRRFGGKFSYCFVDLFESTKKSWLMFGDSAVSRTAVYTPLLSNPHPHSVLGTYYYVELIGISVGGARVPEIRPSLFKFDSSGDGGVLIDSGTAVTRLVQPAYIALRDAFRRAINLKRVGDEESGFDTCYDLSKKKVKVPSVVLHFRNADVSLSMKNVMLPVSESGISCLAFMKSDDNSTIIGSIQQQGFRVVFDVPGSRIGFAPGSCA